MPYIITTRQRVQGDSRSMETARAVATLDEARHAMREVICAAHGGGSPFPNSAPDGSPWPTLLEAGGTIGPLPDGTVIEVCFADWAEIAEPFQYAFANVTLVERRRRLIDAFNAR